MTHSVTLTRAAAILALALPLAAQAQTPDRPPQPPQGQTQPGQAQAPEITVQQPAPDVTVEQPAPDVMVTQPTPDVQFDQGKPQIQVDAPEPQVTVAPVEEQVEAIITQAGQPNVQFNLAKPQIQVQEAQPDVQVVTAEEQPKITVERINRQEARLYGAGLDREQLIGLDVTGAQGDDVGEVRDILMSGDGSRIDAVVVQANTGFLNLGNKLVAIPFDQVTYDAQNRALRLGMSEEQVRGLQEYQYGQDQRRALRGPQGERAQAGNR